MIKECNFQSKKEYIAHYDKHKHEWDDKISAIQYLYKAKNLAAKAESVKILVKKRISNGNVAEYDILKYDVKKNEFLSLTQNDTIKTFFRPLNGIEYWNKCK